MSPMVEINGISKTFGRTTALAEINLNIEEGQFFALVGPSGSGKTTLLHILGGFVQPSAGRVRIAGQDVSYLPPARRPTTSMFQDYALFPHMSVGSNVGFGLLMRKVAKSERLARVENALEMVGLSGMNARRVHQLSGGQQQRVALARALVVEPKVLLLDEPLGALDLNLRRQMQQELLHIQKQVGTTFVHVTHDQEEAMSIADIMAVMNNGHLEDVGPPERVYMKPRSRFTANFMGESNMFEGQVIERNGDKIDVETVFGRLQVSGAAEPGTSVHLSIRPEQIKAGGGDQKGHVSLGKLKVREVSFFGTHHRCQGQHIESDLAMIIRLPQYQAAQPGEDLTISVLREDIVLLTQ
ncbi:ABC transporter, ATP-binding protein (cluster 1, maltose/g3p/polyamine/iron); ABC transporter, ATP-binding protein (cluster 10, nitrate/sulfonate/bicarbonate) [Olavius sp. associated proteobacterium Delta 1]|nr:ABC transporter, ATP-binding protein (cluster 1, maltose/g3p/polyamine/iron); ABC transporter, ATP-binding protein (cluster 10, nitrate/sulfonate/bicarbonate) [Olavius sp. associated proteobacterium Delta 1]